MKMRVKQCGSEKQKNYNNHTWKAPFKQNGV